MRSKFIKMLPIMSHKNFVSRNAKFQQANIAAHAILAFYRHQMCMPLCVLSLYICYLPVFKLFTKYLKKKN